MGFLAVIGQVGIFMICAQAILHFRPKAVYEKYLRLLVSAMILIQLFQPFYRFLGGGEAGELEARVTYFRKQLEEQVSLSGIELSGQQDRLWEKSLEEVEKRMAEQREGDKGQQVDNSGEELEKIEILRVEIGEKVEE